LDPKIAFDHLDDLPLPGRPADSPRIEDDEITLPGHPTSFLLWRFGVLGNGSGGLLALQTPLREAHSDRRGVRRGPDLPCQLPMLSG
jgi:hypothetical protein